MITSTDKPFWVDFGQVGCIPCRSTKPNLEKIAEEYKNKVEFLPIDADVSQDILEHFKVISIPIVLTVRDGEMTGRVTGAQSEDSYRATFEALAEVREVTVLMSRFDRMLRLSVGMLLAMVGISTGNWLVLGIGGLVSFFGMYDRCPIWRAVPKLISSGIMRHTSER